MAIVRKPIPGKDEGQWGQILNDFLDVVHKSDGTLKDGVVGEDNLSAGVKAKLGGSSGSDGGSSTPAAHAASHASDGSDTITPASIGAQVAGSYASATHTHAQADVTGLVNALSGKVSTDDSRLSDARTPTAHSHTTATIDSGEASSGQVLIADGLGGTAWSESLQVEINALWAAIGSRSPADTWAHWGDSMTAASSSGNWAGKLAAITGQPHYNGGVGGESATQIAARMTGGPGDTYRDRRFTLSGGA